MPSISEVEKMVPSHNYDYRTSDCTIFYSIGATKSVSYYAGRGNCKLELNCESMSEGTVTISGNTFVRLAP